MAIDPRCTLNLSMAPGTFFIDSGVAKWASSVGTIQFTQATSFARPAATTNGMYFDGNDTLLSATPKSLDAEAGRFTLEYWQTSSSTAGALIALCANASTYTSIQIFNHALYMANSAGTGWGVNGLSIGTLVSGRLTHYAITRGDDGIVRTYQNGVQQASTSYATALYYNAANTSYIASNLGGSVWSGHISDIRFYLDCLYPGGASFVPPRPSQVTLQPPPMPPMGAISAAVIVAQFDSGD